MTDKRYHEGYAAIAVAVLSLLLASGCGRDEEAVEGGPPERVVTVETTSVEKRPWSLVARAVGSLTADPQVRIRNEVSGVVDKIEASEGTTVDQGDVLVRLDSEKAAFELQRADARFKQAEANLMRRQTLFEQELITEAEMIEAEAEFQSADAERSLASRRLSDMTIRAPFAGTLGRRFIARGDFVEAGSHLFDLVQLDPLHLEFDLPERYLPQLHIGQPVRVVSAAFPEETFEGEVDFINPIINRSTRTVPVRARVENTDGLLRPNLFVTVELDVTLIDEALVIPEQAIVSELGHFSVYVVNGEQRAEIRTVRVGEREPGWVQIREGLSAEDVIVTAGQQRLQLGVRVTEQAQNEER